VNKPAVQRQSRPLLPELSGIDPIEDLEVTVRDGQLSIKASRREPKDGDGGSEFVYGTFERTVALPVGADEDDDVLDAQAEQTGPEQQEQPVG
jgi:HSP20 family molecular chaperone IbpA